MIDVGQGDCSLIITQTGKRVLIDGGGSLTPDIFNTGTNITLPYLLDRKIISIDYIMMSHFDSDHAQGIEAVIENIKVKNIIISKQMTISDEFKKIINICKEKKISVTEVKKGDIVIIDKDTYFEILSPDVNNFIDDGKGGLNSNAIVAKLYKKINQKTFTILFTGDIEEKTEENLLEIYSKNYKLKSDILKVAHHGSKTSSTYEFLKNVNARIALIGVGKDNKFGHPNAGVIDRLKNLDYKIYRTDKDGEITIKVDKNGKITIKTQINE